MLSEEERSSSDDLCEVILSHVIERPGALSDDDNDSDNNEEDSDTKNVYDKNWFNPSGYQPRIKPFVGAPGVKTNSTIAQFYNKPAEFYSLLVTEEMFETIARHTNTYADQVLSKEEAKPSWRLQKWIPTDKSEIKKFFGLVIWMGLVKLPSINLYWSKDIAFEQTFPRSVMSRNRFELLLQMINFASNEDSSSDPLHKVRGIVDALNQNFKMYYDPGEMLCIDECIIPFRGRISKHNKQKHGVKLLKLCTVPGFTYCLCVHPGKNINMERIKPVDIVMSLCGEVLGRGHTICTDIEYTSIDLANKLIAAETHLIGTLRATAHKIPSEVVSARLKPGEFIAKENESGITVLKWRSKYDVLLLSTKHSTEVVSSETKRGSYVRPKVIIDYNEGKSFVNTCDQMTGYFRLLRKNVKWYKKLAFELLVNTAVINALIMFNSVSENCISVIEFRKELVMHLTRCREEGNEKQLSMNTTEKKYRHEIQRKEGLARQVRRCCTRCYKQNVNEFGRQGAKNRTIKVVTFCADCAGQPHLCLPCFNIQHRNIHPS